MQTNMVGLDKAKHTVENGPRPSIFVGAACYLGWCQCSIKWFNLMEFFYFFGFLYILSTNLISSSNNMHLVLKLTTLSDPKFVMFSMINVKK